MIKILEVFLFSHRVPRRGHRGLLWAHKLTAAHTFPQEPRGQNKAWHGSVQSPFLRASFNSQQVLKQVTAAEIPGQQSQGLSPVASSAWSRYLLFSAAFCDLYKKIHTCSFTPICHYLHPLSQNQEAIKMVSWLPWKPLSLFSVTIKKSPPKTWLMFSAHLFSYSAVELLSLHGNRTTNAKINCNPSALLAWISAALQLQPLWLYRSLSMNLKEPLISG